MITKDPDGILIGYSDGTTSATYTYDDMGRKLSETVNYGPFSKSFSYTYFGNGLKHTFTSPDSTVYTYNYGLNNELQDIQIPSVGSITIPTYTWNRPATINYPGGTQRSYTYDALMRIQTLNVVDPNLNSLLNYQYSYDEVGNILTKTTEHGNYSYGYDNVSRLLTADNPTLDDEVYTYDGVGNRLTAAGVAGTWNYNDNNELLGYTDVEYTYDANGNMTQITVAGSVVWTYTYDAANRLVHVKDGTGTISADYGYDPFGRRLWKDVGGTRTYFFYSEEGLIAEYDENGVEIRSYGYKPDSTWTTDPLWLKVGSTYYWYQNDHLGTPQKLTAQDGTVVWSAQYTAFGEAVVQVETVTNNLRFPGQYEDAETGLHYNRFRYYDPRIGRYLRVDPIGWREGKNFYAYALNNPGKETDPLGLWVHPTQIIPPLEAFMLVDNAQMNVFLPYNINPWIRKKFIEKKVQQYGLTQEHAELINSLLDESSQYKNGIFLSYLTYINWPGGTTESSHNKFVFTCKCGWIDMGHFFQTAAWAYWARATGLGDSLDTFIAIGFEYIQEFYRQFDVFEPIKYSLTGKANNQAASAFTPEDFLSNELGVQFGAETWMTSVDYDVLNPLSGSLIGYVTSKWYEFLVFSGAVAYQQDDEVHRLLQRDVSKWWNYGKGYTGEYSKYTGPRQPWDTVKNDSEAYHQLCCCNNRCQDYPINADHIFPQPMF